MAEGKLVGQGVMFERIRRITGYLVGTLQRFNNAKRAEERDRVKHIRLQKWEEDDKTLHDWRTEDAQ